MSEKPPWRVALEQFERSIGAPLEEYIKTDEFADMATAAAKRQAQLPRDIEVGPTQWLHAMNLPTASDVAELRAEIAELRGEVRSLASALASEKKGPARRSTATRAPSARRVSSQPSAKRASSAKSATTEPPAKRAPAGKRTKSE